MIGEIKNVVCVMGEGRIVRMNEHEGKKETLDVADVHETEGVRAELEQPTSTGKTWNSRRLVRLARYVAPVVVTLAASVVAKAALGTNDEKQQIEVYYPIQACVPALSLVGSGLLGMGVAVTGWISLYQKYRDKAKKRQNNDSPGTAQ